MTKRQLQSAAKKVLQSASEVIAATLAEIHELETATRETVARKLTLVGIALDEGSEAIISGHVPGVEDWRAWARESVPGVSVSTVYRYRNAGTVARLIAASGRDISDVSYLTFVPFYRYLTHARSDEDRTAAEAAILAGWNSLVEAGDMSADAAIALVEAAGIAASQGKNAGDAEKGAEDRKSAQSKKKTKQNTPNVGGTSEDREACGSQLDSSLARFADEPDAEAVFLAGMLAALKLAEVFSVGTVFSVTKSRATAASKRQRSKVSA